MKCNRFGLSQTRIESEGGIREERGEKQSVKKIGKLIFFHNYKIEVYASQYHTMRRVLELSLLFYSLYS